MEKEKLVELLEEFRKGLEELNNNIKDSEDSEEDKEENLKLYQERKEKTLKSTEELINKSKLVFVACGDGGVFATGTGKDKMNCIANLMNMMASEYDVSRELFDELLDTIYEEEE